MSSLISFTMRMPRAWLHIVQCTGILFLSMMVSACHQSSPANLGEGTPSVAVISPRTRQVQATMTVSGTVSASKQVDLVARVSGYLTRIGFKDGAVVHAGQILFEIEPQSYRAQFEADRAAYQVAAAEYARQQSLLGVHATSEASLESARGNRDQALAKSEISRLQLSYTSVVAPFTGRIGERQVDVGNLVGSGTPTKLATLEALAPLYVNLTLSEAQAASIGLFDGHIASKTGDPSLPMHPIALQVTVAGSKASYRAQLDFIDNAFDSGTGTLHVRGTIESNGADAVSTLDTGLLPGMSVQVTMSVGAPHRAMLIPQSALTVDQTGSMVMVVGADHRVTQRAVERGAQFGQDVEITAGLHDSEQVVADGGVAVTSGQAVRIVSGASSTPTSDGAAEGVQ